jgi:hypothetical protein
MRTLTLTSPIMKGPDVVRVQHALNTQHKAGLEVDGEYGPMTAAAAKRWRHKMGFKVVSGVMPERAQRILLGEWPLSPVEKARAKTREIASHRAETQLSVPEKAVRWMEERAGLTESPRSSNRVPKLQADGKAAGLSSSLYGMGWPWCAYATSLSNLVSGGHHGWAGLIKGWTNPLYCPTILADAKAGKNGLRVVPKDEAKRGDLLLFDWQGDGTMDHIGRARAPWKDGKISTVEGNTSFDNSGSQSDGGAMALRIRSWGQIAAVVRDDKKR